MIAIRSLNSGCQERRNIALIHLYLFGEWQKLSQLGRIAR